MYQLPDFDYIRRRIPILPLARQLGLTVDGVRGRCWRPANHRNGDAHPSVGFSNVLNRARCFVCDPHSWSTIDLVINVHGCELREAISWIIARYDVPSIAKGKHLTKREEWLPRFRAGDVGTVVEMLVRSGIWSTMSHAERSILPALATFVDRETGLVPISYRGLMQYSGVGSSATISAALQHFEQMKFLKITRGPSIGPLRRVNQYQFTFDDPQFQAMVLQVFRIQRAEIDLEKELRAEAKAARLKLLLGVGTQTRSLPQPPSPLNSNTEQKIVLG